MAVDTGKEVDNDSDGSVDEEWLSDFSSDELEQSLEATVSHQMNYGRFIEDLPRPSLGVESLTPSILDYPVEYGRRYHSFRAGDYVFPNDELEMQRLDLLHMVMTKAMGNKLFLAPIGKEQLSCVLDMGTGSGIWAIEMADMFPNAQARLSILGNDLSPVQPSRVPPNVNFEVDDIESSWVHDTPFNFIFGRSLGTSVRDWPKLLEQTYRNLNRGGWAEFQDIDLRLGCDDETLHADKLTAQWNELLITAAERLGRDPSPGSKLEGWAARAGFRGVVHRRYKLPVGTWPLDPQLKEIGRLNLAQLLDGLDGLSMRLACRVLGWGQEEVRALLRRVSGEMKRGNMHIYMNLHVVYGQKL